MMAVYVCKIFLRNNYGFGIVLVFLRREKSENPVLSFRTLKKLHVSFTKFINFNVFALLFPKVRKFWKFILKYS